MLRLARFWFIAGIAAFGLAGCGTHWTAPFGPYRVSAPPVQPLENPMFVPIPDSELVFNQVVDELDDYFRIAHEQRVHEAGGVLLEGKVESYPMTGSTIFEPWRPDATPGFEKLHGTLQTLRRTATVRVIPRNGGFLIDVNIIKELEDLSSPERATVSNGAFRNENAMVRPQKKAPSGPVQLGWIALGRDLSLEQQFLVELRARLENIKPPKHTPK